MKSIRPRTPDAGLFVVLIASDEELEALIKTVGVALADGCESKLSADYLTKIRVDLMRARYGNRKHAAR